jgi:sulfide:quinone oxidoreductase
MYLAEEVFRANGVRDKSRVVFLNAKSTLFTAPYYIPALERVINSRGMEVQLGQELVALRPDAHEAVFRDVKTGAEQGMTYDMIHVTPPLSPPAFVRTGRLANADGWIEVDKFSLQHVRYPEVFSLGEQPADVEDRRGDSKTGARCRREPARTSSRTTTHGAV